MAAIDATNTLPWEDILVVVAYFVCVIAVGVFAMCRANRGTVSGYFLAGRSMLFFPVGASLFVSNIGTEHFIGLSGSGAAEGIGVGAWEFNALLILQMLGFIFVPVYIASAVYTMPEYLSKRFGGTRLRIYFAVLSLVLYIFTKCSVDLYTGGLFIQQSLGWDLYLCIIGLIMITALLTITGGLTAVIYTDTLQASLMVVGAIILMIMGFKEVGGYDGFVRRYMTAEPDIKSYVRSVGNGTATYNETVTCDKATPGPLSFTMLKDASDKGIPWAGFLLGQTPGSIWYWCTDQVIVQRALAAKSLSHAQGATLLAGFIKILPLFIMVMPGMMSRIIDPNRVACVTPDECMKYCQSKAGCTNIAYPSLVLNVMPTGLRGLMMAVMIAALMSDLDSIFNSASTLFTIDIWKRIRRNATVRELMIVGRLFVCVMVAVAIAWVPVVKETQGGQVFIYIQEVTNYFAPPVAAVFLMGIFIKGVNERGVFWGLMASLLVGVARLALVFIFPGPQYCGDDTPEQPRIIRDFQYMYFAMFIFWLTVIVACLVSLATNPPHEHLLIRTTWWTRYDTRDPQQVAEDSGHGEEYMACQTFTKPALAESQISLQEATVKTGDNGDDKVVFRDPDLVNSEDVLASVEMIDSKPWYLRAMNWFCGLNDVKHHQSEEERVQVSAIQSLEQDPRARIVTHIFLVIILSVGVFMFFFWSYWEYVPDPVQGILPTKNALNATL